jgi:hypothetical protein
MNGGRSPAARFLRLVVGLVRHDERRKQPDHGVDHRSTASRAHSGCQAEDDPASRSRMLPRSLMVPPGFPDLDALARAGNGRSSGTWSGWGAVASVDVSTDGGATWTAADLDDDIGSPWAWRRWTFPWDATPGTYEMCCRARDEVGNEQPLEPEWNVGGYANNAVQRPRLGRWGGRRIVVVGSSGSGRRRCQRSRAQPWRRPRQLDAFTAPGRARADELRPCRARARPGVGGISMQHKRKTQL